MDSEKWQAFNFILSENINSDINEQLFENKVIQAFGELGWKEYSGNIKVRPSYRIGSVNTIEPDLVFKSDKSENLFVIEVKKPSVKLNSNFQDQLFSYMRQLKLEIGILIGEKIQVFYDGAVNSEKNPVLLESINFNRDSERGKFFVELFDKSKFTEESIDLYVAESIERINKNKSFSLLEKELESEEFANELLGMVKKHLLLNYDKEVVNEVVGKFNLELVRKDTEMPNEYQQPKKNIRFIPAKESGFRQYTSSHGALPITLNPSDEYDFKRRLLRTRIK